MGVQPEQRQQFVARREKCIAALVEERSKEVARMEEGKANFERLRQAVAAQQFVAPPECPSEMEQLRRQIAEFQRQLGQAESPAEHGPRVTSSSGRSGFEGSRNPTER